MNLLANILNELFLNCIFIYGIISKWISSNQQRINPMKEVELSIASKSFIIHGNHHSIDDPWMTIHLPKVSLKFMKIKKYPNLKLEFHIKFCSSSQQMGCLEWEALTSKLDCMGYILQIKKSDVTITLSSFVRRFIVPKME